MKKFGEKISRHSDAAALGSVQTQVRRDAQISLIGKHLGDPAWDYRFESCFELFMVYAKKFWAKYNNLLVRIFILYERNLNFII